MDQNSELVDFERGSTFGGIITTFVFVGFIFLLVYDLQENINNLPYTFEVRDKYMSPREHKARVVNLGDYQNSTDLVVGFVPFLENGSFDTQFNPLDNDYIEMFGAYWDSEKNQ